MKADTKTLEKLLKKILRQERVDSAGLLDQWLGLGLPGTRVVIDTLNRRKGWENFLLWAESEPSIYESLVDLADRAGVSESGMLALKAAGIAGKEGETPRSQSLWVLQTVRSGAREDWPRAFELIRDDQDLLEGSVSLLEMEETPEVADFLTALLNVRLPGHQDQLIRKALYRLKQKGIQTRETPRVIPFSLLRERKEIFYYSQNISPFWNTLLYLRGTFGGYGELFVIEFEEGSHFKIVDQKGDVPVNQKVVQLMASALEDEMKKSGAPVRFVRISPPHARYFLQKSFELLPQEAVQGFRRYMGEGESQYPLADMNPAELLDDYAAEELFDSEDFYLWVLPKEQVQEVFQRLKDAENPVIILPDHQLEIKKKEVMSHELQRLFDERTRRIWALALEKAAFFLKESDAEHAGIAVGFARLLLDLTVAPEAIPFIWSLLEISLRIYSAEKEEQEEQNKSSLIMTPDEFERSLREP